MEHKLYWVIFSIAALVFLAGVFLYFFGPINLSPTTNVILEPCHTFKYSGENQKNIVFFASENETEKYSQFLNTISPFKENINSFNIYYIDSYAPDCTLYKDIALFCYSKELVKKSSSCPNDFIFVVKQNKSEIRSSTYSNVISINSEQPLTVLPHEFAHALANLADEYSPSTIPSGAKNCVVSCDKFDAETDGCFQSCSVGEYYRSIDSGIMRSLSSKTFGKFDESLILSKLTASSTAQSSITANAIEEPSPSCSQNQYYLVEGLISQSSIRVLGKTIENGCPGSSNAGSYSYTISNNDGSTAQYQFNPEFVFTDSPGETQINGEVFNYEGTFFVKIPVEDNQKSMSISNAQNVKIAEIALDDKYSRPCRIQ